MANRTEQEIMQNWKYTDPPLVSVVCITYNHEPYIRDAIEGFLLQETDFPFEIIIHDDASTDRTPKIIRDYCERYPQLIIPIFQQENQYSKGENPALIAFSRAKGEFIAICEGDDYWLAPNKLRIQIDTLKKNRNCELCFHSAYERNEVTKKESLIAKRHKEDTVFPVNVIIKGDGGFCPTASLVIRRSAFEKIPDWVYKEAPVGDYFWQVYGSLRGGALYIDKAMCVYRTSTNGSWSNRMANIEYHLAFYKRYIHSLNLMDADLDYQYVQEIRHVKAMQHLNAANVKLRAKDLESFKDLISISWKTKPFVTKGQFVLFLLSPFPFLALAFRLWRDRMLP